MIRVARRKCQVAGPSGRPRSGYDFCPTDRQRRLALMTPPTGHGPTVSTRRVLESCLGSCLLGVALWLSGCASGVIPPTYTPEELAATCERTGGVWRRFVGEGYCEYRGGDFL